MDKFVIFCWLVGYAALCGIVIIQHTMITDLSEQYRIERAISDLAVVQAAKCINSRKKYINVGG